MRIPGLTAAAAMLLAGCEGRDNASESPPAERPPGGESEAPSSASSPSAPTTPSVAAARWDLQSSGEGTALALMPKSGPEPIRLFCPSAQDRLLVNVPAFRPIASEERLSFGSGGEAVALVAHTRGDRQRGGISGTGEVPDNLAALVGGPLSASYGAQRSGPHPAPPHALARAFVAACREGAALARPPVAPPATTPSMQPLVGRACLMQDGEHLRVAPLRAVGTEPFWGARIEGRCVTYSHPEDRKGTRVWTRFTPAAGGGAWVGALGSRPFELRTRAQPGCSDGMSDRSYSFAVDLLVGGERRTGCAAPLGEPSDDA